MAVALLSLGAQDAMTNKLLAYIIDSCFVLMGAIAIGFDPEDAWVGGVAVGLAAFDFLLMGNDLGVPDEPLRR